MFGIGRVRELEEQLDAAECEISQLNRAIMRSIDRIRRLEDAVLEISTESRCGKCKYGRENMDGLVVCTLDRNVRMVGMHLVCSRVKKCVRSEALAEQLARDREEIDENIKRCKPVRAEEEEPGG